MKIRNLKEYNNVYLIMKRALLIRNICIAFLLLLFFLSASIAFFTIIYASNVLETVLLILIGCILPICIISWAFIQDSNVDVNDLEKVNDELRNSLFFKGKMLTFYITANYLVVVRGGILHVILIDNIESIKIKSTRGYNGMRRRFLEVVTPKVYCIGFSESDINVIEKIIKKIDDRKDSLNF